MSLLLYGINFSLFSCTGSGRPRKQDCVSDSGSDSPNENNEERQRKLTRPIKDRKKGGGRKRKRANTDSGSECGNQLKDKRGKKQKAKPWLKEKLVSAKQRLKFVSKETISTSESDSDKPIKKSEIGSDITNRTFQIRDGSSAKSITELKSRFIFESRSTSRSSVASSSKSKSSQESCSNPRSRSRSLSRPRSSSKSQSRSHSQIKSSSRLNSPSDSRSPSIV